MHSLSLFRKIRKFLRRLYFHETWQMRSSQNEFSDEFSAGILRVSG